MAPFPRMQFQARLSDFIPVFSATAAPRISPKGQAERREREKERVNEFTEMVLKCVCFRMGLYEPSQVKRKSFATFTLTCSNNIFLLLLKSLKNVRPTQDLV